MKLGPFYYVKGATAYEFQVGKHCFRFVHLHGGGLWAHWLTFKRFQYMKEVPHGSDER